MAMVVAAGEEGVILDGVWRGHRSGRRRLTSTSTPPFGQPGARTLLPFSTPSGPTSPHLFGLLVMYEL